MLIIRHNQTEIYLRFDLSSSSFSPSPPHTHTHILNSDFIKHHQHLKLRKKKTSLPTIWINKNKERKTMTISLYPSFVIQRNLSPEHGGAKIDELCEQIHSATKGWGVSWLGVCISHEMTVFTGTYIVCIIFIDPPTQHSHFGSFFLFLFVFYYSICFCLGKQEKDNWCYCDTNRRNTILYVHPIQGIV